jgi:four helix bundle protein
MAESAADALKRRTKSFALSIVSLVQTLPDDRTAQVLGRQLLRCGTAVGANYRSACRARSRADFVSKIAITEEEADETLYWLELLREAGSIDRETHDRLHGEAHQLTAIFSASRKTARAGQKQKM